MNLAAYGFACRKFYRGCKLAIDYLFEGKFFSEQRKGINLRARLSISAASICSKITLFAYFVAFSSVSCDFIVHIRIGNF